MKKILFSLALMSALLVSCEKPENEYSISISPTELIFDATGGDKTVTITSTGEWSVAYTSDDWFELSATSGQNGDKITITADPYDNTEEERYAFIDFSCGNKSASVSIAQSAKEHSVSVMPTEIKAEAEGGKYEITVTSTSEWTVTADNWITLSTDKGNNGDIVTLSIDYNDTEEERIGAVAFDCKGKTVTITVTQQPDNSPIIQFKDRYFLDALLETYTVEWNNTDYRVDVDKNNDGQISEKEAACVEILKIGNYNIRNADELKYFTSLTYLDCNSNLLTSLDVSNNTALEYLNCCWNGLTTLDLSNNTALEYLDCIASGLTSLDVSNNTALTSLNCYWNVLTTLDVSNNTALTYLDCGYNELTSLVVSNNKALTILQCNSNELTSLDVSNNTALTSLSCWSNQLTTLDVSNNTALTYLYCENNQLTTLDVSGCTALTELECYNNQLTSLDLSNNKALTNLRCSNNPLQELILYKYHIVGDGYIDKIESEYGDIIEYVE